MLGIALTILLGAVVVALVFVLSACILSSRISRMEEQQEDSWNGR